MHKGDLTETGAEAWTTQGFPAAVDEQLLGVLDPSPTAKPGVTEKHRQMGRGRAPPPTPSSVRKLG